MHENANISKDQNETNKMFDSILLTQTTGGGGGSSGGKSQNQIVAEVAQDMLDKLPAQYDIEQAKLKYPVVWSESMNTVLVQELQRFNKTIAKVRETLVDIGKALKGLAVMSGEMELLGKSLFFGRVPALWDAVSYPSLKPLNSYFNDLLDRIKFLGDWLHDKPPNVYWISGFNFTQAFLTGLLQNYARKYTIPIDSVGFDFEVMKEDNYDHQPDDGAYVSGLFFDAPGGTWRRTWCQIRCPKCSSGSTCALAQPCQNGGRHPRAALQLPRVQNQRQTRHAQHHRSLDQLRDVLLAAIGQARGFLDRARCRDADAVR